MKKILLFIILLLFFACNPPSNVVNNISYVKSNGYVEYTKYQFDSICTMDTLSNNLNNWINLILIDEETKAPIQEYMYIKNDKSIYTLIKRDSIFSLQKRIEH